MGRRCDRFKACGFTLVELLFVIAILGTISLIAVPRMQAGLTRAKIASFQAKSHTLGVHYSDFAVEWGVCPEEIRCPAAYVPPGGALGDKVRFDSPPYDADYYFRCTLTPGMTQEFFLDPFDDPDRHNAPFMASGKDELHQYFPFQEGEQKGSVAVSRGPDRKIAEIYGPFAYSGMVYDPSNGVCSEGDIFYLMPELSKPRFDPANF